jgi:hypothetical protein
MSEGLSDFSTMMKEREGFGSNLVQRFLFIKRLYMQILPFTKDDDIFEIPAYTPLKQRSFVMKT